MVDCDDNGVPVHTTDLIRYLKHEALDLFDMDDEEYRFTALLLQAASIRLQEISK
jgi:hypothetical protein